MKVYALQVITGMEERVAGLIRESGNAKIKKVYSLIDPFGAPLFPGYIFLEMELDGDTYRPVLDTPFVVQYLCPASGVHSLQDEEAGRVSEYVCVPITTGARVEIVDGPFKGLSGKILLIKMPYLLVDVEVFEEAVTLSIHIKYLWCPYEDIFQSGKFAN